MEAGAVARPAGRRAPFVAVDARSENLSLPPGALFAGSAHCAVCRRAPVVGETVTVYRGAVDSFACDQCECKPAAERLGDPVRRERVRTTAGALTVRRII